MIRRRLLPHGSRLLRLLAGLAAVALAGCTAVLAPPPGTIWSTVQRYGHWEIDGHTIYNNVWGSGYGPQRTWLRSARQWGVRADHPDTGGIKSYPNITRFINRRISTLQALSARVDFTAPAGGAWNAAFDIWDEGHRHEIMVWLDSTGTPAGGGNVKPISREWTAAGEARPVVAGADIGGTRWNVFRGTNGFNEVFSFLRAAPTRSADVDLKAILDWLVAQRWMADVVITEVQFGWEITSSPGGHDWQVNDYALTVE